jgi:hypothetical protein
MRDSLDRAINQYAIMDIHKRTVRFIDTNPDTRHIDINLFFS